MATAKSKAKPKSVTPARATPTRDEIREIYATQRREAVAALREAGLDGRVAELEPLMRDAIAITALPRTRKALPVGESHLGGGPDMPPGTAWPAVNGEPLPFVAQLRLEDVAPYDIHDKLPSTGHLAIFAGPVLDKDGTPVVHARVLHFPAGSALAKVEAQIGTLHAHAIELSPCAELPPYCSNFEGYDKAYESFYGDRYGVWDGVPRHTLFGYDAPYQLRLAPGEEMLLRLDAGENIPYDFVEAVALYVMLPGAALAARDFGPARAVEAASR